MSDEHRLEISRDEMRTVALRLGGIARVYNLPSYVTDVAATLAQHAELDYDWSDVDLLRCARNQVQLLLDAPTAHPIREERATLCKIVCFLNRYVASLQ